MTETLADADDFDPDLQALARAWASSPPVPDLATFLDDAIRNDPAMSFDPGADMIMDAWIDGRHYEIVVSRLPDDEALPEPTYEPRLRMPVDALDQDDFRFDEDFVKEWA